MNANVPIPDIGAGKAEVFRRILIQQQLKGQTLSCGFPFRVHTLCPLQEMPHFQSDKTKVDGSDQTGKPSAFVSYRLKIDASF